jgi:hypothetical protein
VGGEVRRGAEAPNNITRSSSGRLQRAQHTKGLNLHLIILPLLVELNGICGGRQLAYSHTASRTQGSAAPHAPETRRSGLSPNPRACAGPSRNGSGPSLGDGVLEPAAHDADTAAARLTVRGPARDEPVAVHVDVELASGVACARLREVEASHVCVRVRPLRRKREARDGERDKVVRSPGQGRQKQARSAVRLGLGWHGVAGRERRAEGRRERAEQGGSVEDYDMPRSPERRSVRTFESGRWDRGGGLALISYLSASPRLHLRGNGAAAAACDISTFHSVPSSTSALDGASRLGQQRERARRHLWYDVHRGQRQPQRQLRRVGANASPSADAAAAAAVPDIKIVRRVRGLGEPKESARRLAFWRRT